MKIIIRAGSADPYEVSADDKLWLLRAVEAEGAPKELVARTLINLFAWARAHGKEIGQSLAKTVRTYAQPVNPAWYPGGQFVPLNAAPEELARAKRRRDVHSTRTAFSASTVDAVERALTTSWSLDWTDYAAPGVDGTRKGYERRTNDLPGQNTFWTRAPGWPGYSVELEGELLADGEPVPSAPRTISSRALASAQELPWWVWLLVAAAAAYKVLQE